MSRPRGDGLAISTIPTRSCTDAKHARSRARTSIATSSHSNDPACGSKGYPALGIIEVTGGSADTTVYIDDRNDALGNDIWIYQEANAIWSPKDAGVYMGDAAHKDLQRGPHCWQWSPCYNVACVDDPFEAPNLQIAPP